MISASRRALAALVVLATAALPLPGAGPFAVAQAAAFKPAHSAANDPAQFDRYGGWKEIRGKATGRFHVERLGGRWWFITPEGHGLWVNGPARVVPSEEATDGTDPYRDAIMARYGSEEGWRDQVKARFADMSINAIGGFARASVGLWTGHVPYAVGSVGGGAERA